MNSIKRNKNPKMTTSIKDYFQQFSLNIELSQTISKNKNKALKILRSMRLSAKNKTIKKLKTLNGHKHPRVLSPCPFITLGTNTTKKDPIEI